jgi:hypothetical protein
MLVTRRELQALIEAEMDLTLQLAVMLAAGHTATSAGRHLGMTAAEIAIGKERLARVAHKWQDE